MNFVHYLLYFLLVRLQVKASSGAWQFLLTGTRDKFCTQKILFISTKVTWCDYICHVSLFFSSEN